MPEERPVEIPVCDVEIVLPILRKGFTAAPEKKKRERKESSGTSIRFDEESEKRLLQIYRLRREMGLAPGSAEVVNRNPFFNNFNAQQRADLSRSTHYADTSSPSYDPASSAFRLLKDDSADDDSLEGHMCFSMNGSDIVDDIDMDDEEDDEDDDDDDAQMFCF